MIYLKANTELKHIFERLIQTMNAPVKWNNIFVILNNYLMLPGEVRSLIFNFDNRKVNTNVIEIPIVEEAIQPIEQNVPLTNVLNMVLYAFGKWGSIPGLKVEKDYAQLNELFTGILRELKIESGYRDDSFRFYQKGIQMTYEDVIQAAIEAGQKAEEEEAAQEEEKLGLWHNMRWTVSRASFAKRAIPTVKQEKERMGNNFYMIGYQCPECGKNLHMVVYPVDKEFPVETGEGKVYLARAYACDYCNRFYTPRPGKLLSEGDIYLLDFEKDREAFEDYQELLGRRGEKTSNYKFNEYEWERNQKKAGKQADSGQEESAEQELTEEALERLTETELSRLEDKLESGFYAPGKTGKYRALTEKIARQKAGKNKGQSGLPSEEESRKIRGKASKPEGMTEPEKGAKPEKGRKPEGSAGAEKGAKPEGSAGAEKGAKPEGCAGAEEGRKPEGSAGAEKGRKPGEGSELDRAAEIRKKYDARMEVIERMSPRQLKELRESIRKEKLLSEQEKREYIEKVETSLWDKQKKELEKRAENAKKGNYALLCRNIEEIEKSDYPGEMKEPFLAALYQLRQQKAQSEAEELIANMPAVMDRKKYKLFREKLNQYREADISSYEEKLEARRKQAEQQEIDLLVKRAGKNDRGALFRVWQQLQDPDFSKENTKEHLERIHQQLQKLDEAAIERICPNIMGMTFEEGLEAYERVQSGMFLPEIKDNALEMIDKRLTKIKSDENELLVRKLQEELRGKVKETSSLHYNDARKEMLGEWNGTEADIVKCAFNTYASEHDRYEYPIVVCDSTRKETGREGFLLTPERLFYNSIFNSECIPLSQIKNISCSTGLLNKGFYIHQKNGEKTKIPVGIPAKEWESFVGVMKEFIKYLQEKPESRKVSYLAKEEHEVKCCYRCGYVYKGGDVCPKCGSRANR